MVDYFGTNNIQTAYICQKYLDKSVGRYMMSIHDDDMC